MDTLAKEYKVSQATISRWLKDYTPPIEVTKVEQDNARKVIEHFTSKYREVNLITNTILEEEDPGQKMIKWGIIFDKFIKIYTLELQERKLDITERTLKLKELEAQQKLGGMDNVKPIIVTNLDQLDTLNSGDM